MSASAESPLDLSSLRAAARSLAAALQVIGSPEFQEVDPNWRDTLIAGVVQNFEFTFELSWKMLKRQLERTLPNGADLDSVNYRELIRLGHRVGLVDEIAPWFGFRELRNITAHTYAKEKALKVISAAPQLLQHALTLLRQLETRSDA